MISEDSFDPSKPDDVEDEEDNRYDYIFEHCLAVYDAMHTKGKVRTIDEAGNQARVYEGFVTNLITKELGLTPAYYTLITRAMKRMQCVEQIYRGGGTKPSQYIVYDRPTREAFYNAPELERRLSQNKKLQKQIDDLNRRVRDLENKR